MSQTKDQRILSVFENLQRASEENHLPAFERCSEGKGPALFRCGRPNQVKTVQNHLRAARLFVFLSTNIRGPQLVRGVRGERRAVNAEAIYKSFNAV